MRITANMKIIGGSMVALGVLAWYFYGNSIPVQRESQPSAPPPSIRFQTEIPNSNQVAKDPTGSAPHTLPTPLPSNNIVRDWRSVYALRDPYPAIVALREARQKGSFGSAYQLSLACFEALATISRPNGFSLVNPAAPDDEEQLRHKAKAEIEVRCSRFLGQDTLTLATPIAGDDPGERFRNAMNVIRDHAGKGDSERLREAFAEVADQGQLMAVSDKLAWYKSWRGESWRDRSAEFDAARSMAQFLASSNPDEAGSDLRTLTRCYAGSSCKLDRVTATLGFVPTERRPQVEALARDMAQALRSGDVSAWLPGRK